MNRFLLVLMFLLLATASFALRIPRPPTLSFPLKEEEVNQLNKFINDSWLIQNGRVELDVVTTPKTSAKNGEMWIIKTGAVCKIQFKANNIVWTTP